MYGCRSSEDGKTMPIGALHLLEQACGEPIYSQALLNAGPAPSEAECAISEACEASETMVYAQSLIRKAGADGIYTELEKRDIEPELQRVEAHVRSIRAGMEGAK